MKFFIESKQPINGTYYYVSANAKPGGASITFMDVHEPFTPLLFDSEYEGHKWLYENKKRHPLFDDHRYTVVPYEPIPTDY